MISVVRTIYYLTSFASLVSFTLLRAQVEANRCLQVLQIHSKGSTLTSLMRVPRCLLVSLQLGVVSTDGVASCTLLCCIPEYTRIQNTYREQHTGNNMLWTADNFHTLSSQFPQLNQSLGTFSQQSLHALGQQALGQQALHHRSVSLPQRLSPQTGLYDTNPNSLLHALRAHGQPKSVWSLAQQQEQDHKQHQDQPQQLHAAAAAAGSHRRLQALQHELPDREASDNSPSGIRS